MDFKCIPSLCGTKAKFTDLSELVSLSQPPAERPGDNKHLQIPRDPPV